MGGTFSAGGPGKGMYSRLCREVLCRTPYINNATCTNYTYDDIGLLTLYGNCQSSYTGKLVEDLTHQAKQMAERKPDDVELQRAKNALRAISASNSKIGRLCSKTWLDRWHHTARTTRQRNTGQKRFKRLRQKMS